MYLNQDCFDLIDAAFDFLESNEMYGDIDEFAFEVGEVLFGRSRSLLKVLSKSYNGQKTNSKRRNFK
ncbi:hypothetical protein CHCC5027_1412 [Bacillus paralicheniformis]|nr:hypothetical protein CHCC5027_1412 [Bacillus paralicheniformis]